MSVLVTGASGFIGSALVSDIGDQIATPCSIRVLDDIKRIDWTGISTVIHLAGLAHRMQPPSKEEFMKVNRDLTKSLASSAKSNGIRNFIFSSTIKVYSDEATYIDAQTETNPSDAYGESKLAAELALSNLEGENFKVSILRIPLVVGAGAKGNLLSLMRMLKSPLPLPFLGIENRRSMVSLPNLISLIKHLISNPVSGTFLVSDPKPISTSDLAKTIRNSMGFSSPRLIVLPIFCWNAIQLIRPGLYRRLTGSLEVNGNQESQIPGFSYETQLKEAIDDMVQYFVSKE